MFTVDTELIATTYDNFILCENTKYGFTTFYAVFLVKDSTQRVDDCSLSGGGGGGGGK